MEKHREYQDLGDVEITGELDARINAAVTAADEEIEATRVNFRWGLSQVRVVKRAAELAGVPYQTYLKQAVYRQAVQDLKDAASVDASVRIIDASSVDAKSLKGEIARFQAHLKKFKLMFDAPGVEEAFTETLEIETTRKRVTKSVELEESPVRRGR